MRNVKLVEKLQISDGICIPNHFDRTHFGTYTLSDRISGCKLSIASPWCYRIKLNMLSTTAAVYQSPMAKYVTPQYLAPRIAYAVFLHETGNIMIIHAAPRFYYTVK